MENRLPKRNEVPEALTWRLEDIYPATAAWEAELAQVQAEGEKLAAYAGRLSESAAVLS